MDGNTVEGYNCCLHKCNLCVRKAVSLNEFVQTMFKEISSFASQSNKVIALSKLHREKKSKLQKEQHTRFSSSFLMLYSVLVAYKREVFDDDYNNAFPYKIKVVEDYIKILLPLYTFSADLQSNTAHIGLVVPAVLSLIYENLDRMKLSCENQNQFRDDLIFFLKMKFEHELNSKEYLVAAVLNVGFLKFWSQRSFCLKTYHLGLDSILEIVKKYSPSDSEFETTQGRLTKTDKVVSFSSKNDSSDGMNSLRNLTRPRLNSESDDLAKQTKNKILDDEVKKFVNIINNTEFDSTKSFWLSHEKSLPNLFNLALRLLSIPASSAQIERYFSITGQINTKQANSMSAELLETRSILKANMHLLD